MAEKRIFTKEEKELMITMFNEGESYTDIGKKVNSFRTTIKRRLNKWGYSRETKSRSSEYTYTVGEEILGLRILKQTRYGKSNSRAYEVQSIAYPDAPSYITRESNLKKGHGCAYIRNLRIYEGNSLYSVEWVRPYLVDVEEAKTIAPSAGKKMTFKCPDCSREKVMTADKLISRGFSCLVCNSKISFNELAFISYQEYFELGFEYQVTLQDLPGRRLDFINFENRIIIECMGIQHYDKNSAWYESAKEQDEDKRKFSKENNYLLVELDCRDSSMEWFVNTINNCKYLPNIEEKDKRSIIKIMEENKRYPIKEIVELYESGLSSLVLSEKYSLSVSTINRLLNMNNIEIRDNKKRVKCITTGQTFNSVTEAKKWAVKASKINEACKGNQKTAGKHPSTGERLRWEYI